MALECSTRKRAIPHEIRGVTPHWTLVLLFIPLMAHLSQLWGWHHQFHGALQVKPQKAEDRPVSKTTANSITVVLPVRNEAATLPRLINDLANGLTQPFEIIVIDDASDDGTVQAIAPMSKWPFPVRCIANPSNGKKAGLSAGIKAAQTEWVVQVDADVRIQPGFLSAVLEHLASDGANSDMLLLPLRLADKAKGAPARMFDLLQALDFAAMQGWAVAAVLRHKPAMASGGAWVWRQSAFPHDQLRPELASGDDVFSLAALIERGDGHRVGWCGHPEAMASAAPMPDLGSLLDQRIRWGAKSTAYPKTLSEARRVATIIATVHISGLALMIAHPPTGLLFWTAKAFGDMVYTQGVAKAYGLFDQMGIIKRWSSLLLLAFVHPPFIITTMLLMPFRTARWKGRKAP